MSKFHNDVRNALKSLTNLEYTTDAAFDTLVKDCKWKFIEFFETPLEVETKIVHRETTTDHATPLRDQYQLNQDVNAFFNISRLLDIGMIQKKCVGNIISGGYVSNNKIDAIKILRYLTGWYLKDCKNFIEGTPRTLYSSEYILLREVFGNALIKKPEPTIKDILDAATSRKLDPIY